MFQREKCSNSYSSLHLQVLSQLLSCINIRGVTATITHKSFLGKLAQKGGSGCVRAGAGVPTTVLRLGGGRTELALVLQSELFSWTFISRFAIYLYRHLSSYGF